jgi:hypothetical protein
VLARAQANPRQAGLAGDAMLISGGVKMFMDGSGGARTAWMHTDWNKNLTEVDMVDGCVQAGMIKSYLAVSPWPEPLVRSPSRCRPPCSRSWNVCGSTNTAPGLN